MLTFEPRIASTTAPYGSPEEVAETHNRLLDWAIHPNDVVIVIGGYQGATCEFILKRYPKCKLYTFEPQPAMYDVLIQKGLNAFNYALGTHDDILPMVQAGNYFCSFVPDGSAPTIEGTMYEFGSVMDQLNITEIAWMHFNIEGYEYVLLPYLIETGWISRIKQFVVATHPTQPDVWPAIMEKLLLTHDWWWRNRDFWAFTLKDKQ